MKNMRSFSVTYVPYTEKLPARVKIRDNRHRKSVFVPYHSDVPTDRVEDIAYEYLKSRGIVCSHMAEAKKGFILLSDNFTNKIK